MKIIRNPDAFTNIFMLLKILLHDMKDIKLEQMRKYTFYEVTPHAFHFYSGPPILRDLNIFW
jgi:hypothetical protein